MSKSKIEETQEAELKGIMEEGRVPHGWPSNIPFYKDELHNGTLNLRDINILQRAILGHMVNRNRSRQPSYKQIVEEALVEYFERHKDEVI